MLSGSLFIEDLMCYESCGDRLTRAIENNLPPVILSNLKWGLRPTANGYQAFIYHLEETPEVTQFLDGKKKQAGDTHDKIAHDLIYEELSIPVTIHRALPTTPTQSNTKPLFYGILGAIAGLAVLLMAGWLLWGGFIGTSLGLTYFLTGVTLVTCLIGAWYFLKQLFNDLKQKRKPSLMSTLVTLGLMLSYVHTLYHVFMMPMMLTASMMFMSFFMPVLLFILIGGMEFAKESFLESKKKFEFDGIEKLKIGHQKTYQIKHNGLASEIPWFHIEPGMEVFVPYDACIPVDCAIAEDIFVNASAVGGQHYIKKIAGETLQSGCRNLMPEGIWVTAKATAFNSELNKTLLRSARFKEASKTDTQPQWFQYIYAGLIGLSIAASVLVPLLLGFLTPMIAVDNILSLVFAMCPCTVAFGLFGPKILSIWRREKHGIHFKNDEKAIEEHEPTTYFFDKTGTLTTEYGSIKSISEKVEPYMGVIAQLEKSIKPNHPIAKIINQHDKRDQSTIIEYVVTDENTPGFIAKTDKHTFAIGNYRYLKSLQIKNLTPDITDNVIAYVAVDGDYIGNIQLEADIRPEAETILKKLKESGKDIILLTGDSQQPVDAFLKKHNLRSYFTDIHCGLSATKKDDIVKRCKHAVFVGDGLNDSAAARRVSDNDGTSCSVNSTDDAAFFADISMNGKLDYLLTHLEHNHFVKKITQQNQFLIGCFAIFALTLTITFSIASGALPPLAPLLMMLGLTGFTLLNTARVHVKTDLLFNYRPNIFKRWFASDATFAALVLSPICLLTGVIIREFFSASVLMIASNGLFLGGLAIAGIVALSIVGLLKHQKKHRDPVMLPLVESPELNTPQPQAQQSTSFFSFSNCLPWLCPTDPQTPAHTSSQMPSHLQQNPASSCSA